MAAMGEQAPDPYHDYAQEQFQRENGTTKGKGFLGVFPLPNAADPGVASEYSTGDSKFPDYPTLVPTLNASELNRLLNHIELNQGKVPQSVYGKARAFADKRDFNGQPLFAQEGEQRTDILPMFRRIK
jgi:hypothetical protein